MRYLPIDPRTRHVVPWFVARMDDGSFDFRMIHPDRIADAVNLRLCWLCGKRLGAHMHFVIGPMCAINRTTAEPPCHQECARFATVACPWLTSPRAKRRDADLPSDHVQPAGVGLKRNPGVSLIWHTKTYRLVRVENGVLFSLGDPLGVEWLACGRRATRDEVLASIQSGLPLLYEADNYDPRAKAEIDRRFAHVAKTLLPAA